MNLKDMVSGDKQVFFRYYQHGQLWYQTECEFMFPVPIDDTGDGQFICIDKAIYFMRYIRKHIKYLEDAKKTQNIDVVTLSGAVNEA